MNRPLSSYTYSLFKSLLIIICVLGFNRSWAQDSCGVFTSYSYPGGQIASEGYLRDGQPDCYWKTFYETGGIKSEGNRKNFQLDGRWIFYSEQGLKTLEVDYRGGLKHGKRLSYMDGILLEEENFLEDIKEGLHISYYMEGPVKREVPFLAGKEQGNGYEYALDGRLISMMTYKKGVLVKQMKINRRDQEGRKQGYWMWFHDNKEIQMEGTYKNDLRHGYFKYYDEMGNLIKTEKYIEDILQDDAVETANLRVRRSTYPDGSLKTLGGFRNGNPHGVHREYDEEGNVSKSREYKDGIMLAEGGWVDQEGRRQGNWTEYYITGEKRSEGAYENGLRVGKWTYFHRNEKVEQTGRYSRGEPDGLWTWYYDTGMLRKEEVYFRGLEDGESIEYSDSGKVIAKGEYIEGYREGTWFFDIGDHREEGEFQEGEKHGIWKHYYTDTKQLQFEGSFVLGAEDGKHVYYYPNGKVWKQGKYIMGLETGTWIYYDSLGEISLYIDFENGREIRYDGIAVDDLLGKEEDN
jgi:antitoxin component YwqK of YwqJK toxin-antitoxin module